MIPTQVPDVGQIQQLNKNLSDIIQQGIVGFLLLLGIIGVLLAATLFVMAWSRRNRKPDNAPATEAVTAMAQVATNLAKQQQEDKDYQRKKDDESEKRRQEDNNRYLEVITAFTDSNNRIADNEQASRKLFEKIVNDNNSQAVSFQQLVTIGSAPVQEIAAAAKDIKADTVIILEHIQKIEDQLRNQADCLDITERLIALEELVNDKLKRDTDSQLIAVVSVPAEPPPTSNLLTDTGAAKAEGEGGGLPLAS